MASSSSFIKEKTMIFRQWTRLFLLVPLLLSAIQLTPAQALTTNSVIWCPSVVTVPASNRNGCSPLFSTMDLLLTHLDTKDPAVAVTIWMGKDYDSATAGDGNIVIDGAVLTRMARSPLTIKGGWNGPGKSTINLNAPSTLDGATIAVNNWNKKVTIKNIHVVLYVASIAVGCVDGVAAVCVQTKGGIQLDRVSEENSTNLTIDYGAVLDNSTSLSSPPPSVLVTNSSFSKNNDFGLAIVTKGAVNLKSVIANENASPGAYIITADAAPASSVTVSNGQFNQNSEAGLVILCDGTVTLTNIHAEGNAGYGTYVDNTEGPGNVIMKGTNSFLGNDDTGLALYSNGNVTAQYLIAYGNTGSLARGVDINNSTAPSAKAVTISGSGQFIGNSEKGLLVRSKGNVSLNRVSAASNSTGITIQTNGNVILTCSGAYGNGAGLVVASLDGFGSVPKLTLQGFLNSGNTTPEYILYTSIVRTACPIP
jgi:parallel beta helix pectate lyase-like protein